MKRTIKEITERYNFKKLTVVSPGMLLIDAAKILGEQRQEAMIVYKNNKVVGILTEKDIFNSLNKYSLDVFQQLTVKEAMSRKVLYVEPHYTIEECLYIMCNLKIHHLPVFDAADNWPICILSLKSIANVLVSDKQFEISELTKYIVGNSNFNVVETKIKEHKELIFEEHL